VNVAVFTQRFDGVLFRVTPEKVLADNVTVITTVVKHASLIVQ